MNWKRILIGLLVGLVVIGVPVGVYIYLDDSQPPSHPESDSAPLITRWSNGSGPAR